MTGEPAVVLRAGLVGVRHRARAQPPGPPRHDHRPGARLALLRASLRNEGKIHLGLAHANDPSARTADLMLEAALRFDRVVEELVGAPVHSAGLRSSAFRYAVLPGRCECTLRELQDAYARLQTRHDQLTRDEPLTYLGTRPPALWWPLRESRRRASGSGSGVSTGAVGHRGSFALDLARFCQLPAGRARIGGGRGAPLVPSGRRRRAHGRGLARPGRTAAGEPWSMRAAIVVNCLWEDRMRLDAQLGFLPRRPRVHRLKYRVLGPPPAALRDLPSFTPVLGPFGDIVTWPLRPRSTCPGTRGPACVGWSSEPTVPGELAARLRRAGGASGSRTIRSARPRRKRELDRVEAGARRHGHRHGGMRGRSSPRGAPRTSITIPAAGSTRGTRWGRVGLRGVDLGRHRQLTDGAAARAAGGGPGGRGRGVIPPAPSRASTIRHPAASLATVRRRGERERSSASRPARGRAAVSAARHGRSPGATLLAPAAAADSHRGPAHPGAPAGAAIGR